MLETEFHPPYSSTWAAEREMLQREQEHFTLAQIREANRVRRIDELAQQATIDAEKQEAERRQRSNAAVTEYFGNGND